MVDPDSAGGPGADEFRQAGDDSGATVENLLADLSRIGDPDPGIQDEVQDVKQLISEAHQRGLIDSSFRHLQTRDVAEALVGSVIFAAPLLVEDGVFAIADHLYRGSTLGVPVLLVLNTLFVVTMTYALVEWTGRDKNETAVLFDVIPIRVPMILVVSFLVAALMMTVWGRVGDWQPPAEALARINVVWTVGSLGAALGDIISQKPVREPGDGPADSRALDTGRFGSTGSDADRPAGASYSLTDGALIDELHEQYDDLESTVESRPELEEIERLRHLTVDAALTAGFGDTIQKYTSRDIAEGFVGSIFFAIPFLVEDGVFDVATYLLAFRIGVFPVFFMANAVFVILMILAVVYWAGPQDVQMSRPILGVIPRRLVGIAVVAFLTAAALMTLWGRVGGWEESVVALARISVVWAPASFGAALGDILPGESSGADINEELASLGDSIGGFTP